MTKNLKFFLATFLISLPFWWGINTSGQYLENFFFLRISQSPEFLSAQVLPSSLQNLPKKPPEINAKSALSVKIDKDGNPKIIFEKDADQILPIASLTKLMTALITFEDYDLSEKITVSREATDQPEESGQLKVGQKLSVENLLYSTLIESSNDAAYALTDLVGEEAFVDLMNIETKFLGLKNTHFVDPAGYGQDNYSTAKDLAQFSEYLLKNKPEIFNISKIVEFDLYDPDGVFHHKIINTDEILKDYPQVIGSKTGYTTKAEGCLLLILKDPKDGSTLINIILGTEDRFGEMKKLIKYAL